MAKQGATGDGMASAMLANPAEAAHWLGVAQKLQTMWFGFQTEQALKAFSAPGLATDPTQWLTAIKRLTAQNPSLRPEAQMRMWQDGMALWRNMLATASGAGKATAASDLPRDDRRFADPRWREQPVFAMIHQTYLLVAEQIMIMAANLEGDDPAKAEQMRFAIRSLLDAFSPDHFLLTNPVVLERLIATRGESLIKGMENLLVDLKRGQLTHTAASAFTLGDNIAATPGRVVHETPLFQLIQYTPTTDKVLSVPLVIFPPWINRFYILDLNPKKSFVAWAVAQGITTFMVSWKSADASMAEVVWDDYIRAQIVAIEVVRARLSVPAVHAVGYCVAGTTLAATLAVLARRGEGDRVKSATFFTAQVDFEKAGELKHFIDDQQIAALTRLSPEGYLDGRYMAATFNLLRGQDLIWNTVINHYLMGQDYPAFDLLHWNGDTANLPAKWHASYLRDLYRDNRLVLPDSMSADGTPIDLARVTTPAFVQAGREDHIAPPESVWRITRHLSGPVQFTLAGSGHIAGVVNPPAANKYQYWAAPAQAPRADTLEDFIAAAREHKGSWWPHWLEWLRAQDGVMVAAKGKRVPGKRGDRVIEDAPGRYVRMR